ncbi:LysR substrate-binding domain-containing protein [Aquabacterium sp.]|uniref:LysR substrate-binding domain-containing protein n=1 Tax=Aquabacterium sp. TaxID=1872578 RepID=UPI002CF5DA5E|nr:LysR substrate-binding domain-containing protein [Aquabacterium sp.]HSW07221.1 LysR substrate-binding domain-containing protein [Aquabacterium sp.]
MAADPHALRFPSIDGLRAFEAASRLGTFERAADELAITASAVSKRVATLEELVATPLLLRTGKTLALTSAGKEYLGQVSAALGLLAAMPLHQRAVQRIARLRVTTPPTFARQILVPALESFTEAHPEIELELLLSIPFLDSSPHDADIEVRTGADKGQPLLDDRVLPVAAPALIARLPPLREPADLQHAPLLRSPLEPWTPWFRAAGLAWPEPSSGPRLVDLGMTMEAAVSGQGVALARPTLARHWLATGTLQPLFTLTVPAANPYYLVLHRSEGAASVFAHWLQDVCRQAEQQSAAWLSGLA